MVLLCILLGEIHNDVYRHCSASIRAYVRDLHHRFDSL
jgi:hypothetical protein